MKIGVYGGGHVASHLIPALSKITEELICFNRTIKTLESIVKESKANNIFILKEPNYIEYDIDFLIIMVRDDAIISALKKININKNTIIVHTSGGHSVDIIKPYSDYYGVLYPLQTFTKNVDLSIQNIPFIIQGSDDIVTTKIENLALQLSQNVYILDDEQKKTLHIAAVFACNFANHCWVYASELLEAKHISFDIIKPLIQQTVEKALKYSPQDCQTGPAVRGDLTTINQHRKFLENELRLKSNKKDVLGLYDKLTKDIINYYSA